jgi:SAM-dependent methyltransferase
VLQLLFEGAADGSWRRCIVTPSRQAAKYVPWDKFVAQPVRLSRGPAVKLVTRQGNRESTATLTLEQWPARLEEALEAGPCNLDVLSRDYDWHARRTRDGRWLVTRSKPSLAPPAAPPEEPAGHDRVRRHPLSPNNERVQRLFIETGLFGKNGQLLGEAAGKHRQVQHYIELLRHLAVWESSGEVRIVDAGCGKAYLSLALALWAELNGARVRLTGVDSSEDVIATVRGIAERAGLEGARFEAATIEQFVASSHERVDLLLSLHACDTATDEALAAGVRLGAKAIVLVPCCHQELSDQVATRAKVGELPAAARWQSTLGKGLLQHRLADIVTDSLRATALEALGYDTDVLEFVSPEATARNLMIRAIAGNATSARRQQAYARYRALADEWAVNPALERLLGPLWPPAAS